MNEQARREEARGVLPPPCVSLSLYELASGERRLDAEMYLSEGFLIWRTLNRSRLNTVPLRTLANVWQPHRLKGIKVDPEHGVPFLASGQAFDLWPIPRKWLAQSRTPQLRQRYVNRGTILVTCSGTVGTAILVHEPHQGKVTSHDLLRVDVRDEQWRGYIYTFLRSHFGRTMMRSSHYGNIIKHLETHHLESLPVPTLEDLRDQLADDIDEVYRMRDRAFLLEESARALFAGAIGEPILTGIEGGFTVPADELFANRRLDAQFFNPAAEAALHAIEASHRKVEPLGALVAEVFGVPRFKHIYTDSGIPYLDSEPLFKVNPEITKFIPFEAKPNAERYFVKRGWLLMACSGQVYGLNGSLVIASTRHERKIVSNHVLRIVPNGVRVGYLKTVLEHPTLGQPLVLRYAFGTEVPELAPHDIRDTPVVRLDALEDVIADRVEKASELRTKADEKEDAAVARLEKAIDEKLRALLGRDVISTGPGRPSGAPAS